MSVSKTIHGIFPQQRKIVIFSDCIDVAYNEIYRKLDQMLLEYGVAKYQIDPFVAIPNFSIINASFLIRLMSELYGEGSLFLVIMSSISTKPLRIFGKTKSGITFVGNNSGYFHWMFKDKGVEYLYKNYINHTTDEKSFGGKYVQVPTACKILAGAALNELGERIENDCISDFSISDSTVVHCDNFGLIKIYAPPLEGYKEGQLLSIYLNGVFLSNAIFTNSLKNHENGTLVLFKGSSLYGLPELGLVRSTNSANDLGVKVGDKITWEAIS